jgi:hypothetical protein
MRAVSWPSLHGRRLQAAATIEFINNGLYNIGGTGRIRRTIPLAEHTRCQPTPTFQIPGCATSPHHPYIRRIGGYAERRSITAASGHTITSGLTPVPAARIRSRLARGRFHADAENAPPAHVPQGLTIVIHPGSEVREPWIG